MKTLFLTTIALVSLALGNLRAEDAAQKAEQGVSNAADATGNAVKKAAKKTGEAVETAAEDTGRATKKAVKKTGEAVETGAKKVEGGVKKGTAETSELFRHLEKELGKPFTPEQKAKYAEAWDKAQAKARATEQEFADKVSKITGLGKEKSKQIVNEHGL